MRERVRELWVSYEQQVLPPNCSDVQRQETRRAFYAGAFGLFDAMTVAMSEDEGVSPDDERVMIDLAAEREVFLANVKLRRA
jgi:hypothetical protein